MGIIFYSNVVSPPCRAVWLTLKTLGLEFKLHEVNFGAGEHQSAEFLAVNPRGKIPGLNDNGFVLGESRAIMQYLCNKYEKSTENELYPKDPQARAVVDQLLFIDVDAVEEYYSYVKPFQVLFLGEKPGLGDEAKIKKYFEKLEAFLSKTKFLAADHVTIADFSTIASITILDLCKYDNFEAYPKLKKWMDTMRALTGFEECVGQHVKSVTEMYQAKINA